MSRDDILNMPVGRELDALVAEKVMGWKNPWRPFFPSSDISDSGEVIQKYGRVKVFCHQQVTNGNYEVSFVENDFDNVMTATFPTLPEAISKAALLAVME